VLMGMPVVVVLLLLAIFHGLKDGFAAIAALGFLFMLFIVMLVATSVAIDLSSLSLLAALFFSFGGGAMVFGWALWGPGLGLRVLSLCAIVLEGLDLLSSNRSLIGFAVGLKYVFIDEFLPVFLFVS